MPSLHVERIGGLAGFGGTASRIRSHGHIDIAALSAAEQNSLEALFQAGARRHSSLPDEFRYKITRETPKGTEVIEAPESAIPAALAKCVKDDFV